VLAISADLSRSIVLSNADLAPGGVANGSNLYLQDNATSTRRLIAGTSDRRLYERFGRSGADDGFFLGGSANFDTIYFASTSPLTPNAPASGPGIYRWSDGDLSLVSKDAGNHPIVGPEVVDKDLRNPHAVSGNARIAYFDVPNVGVYRVADGGPAVPISVSHRAGDDPTVPVSASFAGASADGRFAFFRTIAAAPALIDGETVSPFSPGRIYRYDGQSDDLELVGDANLSLGQSDDGRTVYFVGGPDLGTFHSYLEVWRDGVKRRVADLAFDQTLSFHAQSHNGRYYAFNSAEKLTQYDNRAGAFCSSQLFGGCKEIYLYDADTDRLSCASCPALGVPARVEPTGGTPQAVSGAYWPRTLLNDGRLFFDTAESLVSGDVNGVTDVYQYDGVRAQLISPGTGSSPSNFADAASDGRDVFFTTAGQAVPQDTDNLTDLYDARVGGGLASQHPAPPPATCDAGRCRQGLPGPTDAPATGSQGAVGTPRAPLSPKKKAKVSIAKTTLTGNTLVVDVKASGRGRIRISGDRLRATTKTVNSAGTYHVKVKLSKKTVAARKAHRRVTVKAVVSFTPPFGSAVKSKLTRTISR
jgi:hypothetical protein